MATGEAEHSAALRPRICVLSLSSIDNDPRVRRQGDAFWNAGWDVIGIGLPGGASSRPAWPVWRPDETYAPMKNPYLPPRRVSQSESKHRHPLVRISRGVALLAAHLDNARAFQAYWHLHPEARGLYKAAAGFNANVWLSNDWTMLPVARELAQENGGVYTYDSHELATEEFADRRRWRVWKRPLVEAIERSTIGDAAVISTVSTGIAKWLESHYLLARQPIVIRNTPAFEAVGFRPAGTLLRVLYHGILTPGRGLEATIDSVAAWRPEFELTLRGPGDADYLHALRCRIAERGLARRVELAPPVPMTALVREAAAYDIGFFALPGSSRHNEFALPNKFFEYVMAGLALCVTDLPEMGRLLREHDLGVTFSRVDPDAIAAAVNALDPSSIDRYKRNALTAARELCWERESERLVAAYAAVIGHPTPQTA